MSELARYLLLFVCLSLTGVICVIVAITTRRYQRRKEETERSFAQGTIVDRVKKVRSSGRGGRATWYVAVVEFTAKERVYRLENENGSRDAEKIVIGQPVEVLYDAADPTHFHLADDDANETASRSLMRMGIMLIIGAAVLDVFFYVFRAL